MSLGTSPCRERAHQQNVRGMGLPGLSAFLAIVLEVARFETEIIYMLVLANHVFIALVVKLTCLTLILLPWVMYIRFNGLKALWCVRLVITIVAVIVAISFAQDVWILMAWVRWNGAI